VRKRSFLYEPENDFFRLIQLFSMELLDAGALRTAEQAAQYTAVFVPRGGLPFFYKVAIHVQGHGRIDVSETLLDRFEIPTISQVVDSVPGDLTDQPLSVIATPPRFAPYGHTGPASTPLP